MAVKWSAATVSHDWHGSMQSHSGLCAPSQALACGGCCSDGSGCADAALQVLLQVVRLADAELMSSVMELVTTALCSYKWADEALNAVQVRGIDRVWQSLLFVCNHHNETTHTRTQFSPEAATCACNVPSAHYWHTALQQSVTRWPNCCFTPPCPPHDACKTWHSARCCPSTAEHTCCLLLLQAAGRIQAIHAAVGHVSQLDTWVTSISESLTAATVDQVSTVIQVLYGECSKQQVHAMCCHDCCTTRRLVDGHSCWQSSSSVGVIHCGVGPVQ